MASRVLFLNGGLRRNNGMNKPHDRLLPFCDVDTFTAGGKGGQHQNKTESAVRLRHRPTGIMVICRDERSQHLNKMRCLENLARKLAKRAEKKPVRIPTKKSRASKRNVIERKKLDGKKKDLRKKPVVEE
jgi:ribosome-associated protein